jgi:hypothetical protein
VTKVEEKKKGKEKTVVRLRRGPRNRRNTKEADSSSAELV